MSRDYHGFTPLYFVLTGSGRRCLLCLWLSGDCQVEPGVRLLVRIASFQQPKVWLRGFEVPRACG